MISRDLKVFPNPATEILTLKYSGDPGSSFDLFVLDLLGQVMYSVSEQTGNEQGSLIRIDISAWPSGVYFVEIRDADEVFTQKVVVK